MKLSKEQFIEKISTLKGKVIYSVNQGKKYKNIRVENSYIKGERESEETFSLDIDALYKAYVDGVDSTQELKKAVYKTNRCQSPALAILTEIRKME